MVKKILTIGCAAAITTVRAGCGNINMNFPAMTDEPRSVNKGDISVKTELENDGMSEYGTVEATANDEVLWTFDIPKSELTELPGISDAYVNNDLVYIVSDNKLHALNLYSGRPKWNVNGVGGGNCITFDNSGNVYVSGYYGPNLSVINDEGELLYRDESDDYCWVYDLHINSDTLYIEYENDLSEGEPQSGTDTLDISQFRREDQ